MDRYVIKDLAEKLQRASGTISHEKMKRWAREFLPPDSKAKKQSGIARELNLDECFTLFLAGHLVADQQISIPDARYIIKDLNDWFLEHGHYPSVMKETENFNQCIWYTIKIVKSSGSNKFLYEAVCLIKDEMIEDDGCINNELEIRKDVVNKEDNLKLIWLDAINIKYLEITKLLTIFMIAMDAEEQLKSWAYYGERLRNFSDKWKDLNS